MPELPEVEFARRNLRRWLVGTRIVTVRVHDARILRGTSARAFSRAVLGRRIRDVDRRGKWLRIGLDDGTRVFSHLGMTGKWILRRPEEPRARFERVRLDVVARRRPSTIAYVDPRLFGRIVVANDDIDEWATLGRDPLLEGLDPELLAEALSTRRRSIKEAIMDQTVIAGVGNIQATEALWRAGIDPRTPAFRLPRARIAALVRGIHDSIAATIADAWGPDGGRGRRTIAYVEESGAPNPFRIYGRAGEPCPRCGRTLERIVLGGRTTVFCPRCQRR